MEFHQPNAASTDTTKHTILYIVPITTMLDYFARGGGIAMQFIAKDINVSGIDTATTRW